MQSPYLVRHTPPGRPRRRLVCFPHAGGTANFYRSWGKHVDPTVEVLAVQYPGRENRWAEPLIPAMDPLASAVSEALSALPPLPTVLFGHSMGAAVAYEVLIRLEQVGAPHITRLCVSGRAPGSASRATLRTDDEVVEAVMSLGGTQAGFFDDPELRELFLPIVRNDYHLIDSYGRAVDTPLLRTDVHALTGAQDPRVTPEELGQWRATTSGSFSLTVFDGDHFYLVPAAERVVSAVLAETPSSPLSHGGAN